MDVRDIVNVILCRFCMNFGREEPATGLYEVLDTGKPTPLCERHAGLYATQVLEKFENVKVGEA